jgi:hypothetical protein
MTSLRPLAALPDLDELAAHPDRVAVLNRDEVQRLLIRHATVATVLLGRLLACERDAPRAVVPPAGPNLEGPEAATYLRIKKSRLDALRRQRLLPAAKIGKAFTYRRDDLDRLREKLAACPSSA